MSVLDNSTEKGKFYLNMNNNFITFILPLCRELSEWLLTLVC